MKIEKYTLIDSLWARTEFFIKVAQNWIFYKMGLIFYKVVSPLIMRNRDPWWMAPQQGSNALGKRYCPRTLKNMKTKIQNLLEHLLKRKDLNLSGAEARFTKSMYEAKQNLTAKRAGGPGEGVQGDRERKAFTTDDQKRIDAWIMSEVICLPLIQPEFWCWKIPGFKWGKIFCSKFWILRKTLSLRNNICILSLGYDSSWASR